MNKEEFEKKLAELLQEGMLLSVENMLKRFRDGTATEKDDANLQKSFKDNNQNIDTVKGNVLDDITKAIRDKRNKQLKQPNLKELPSSVVIDEENNDIDLFIDAMVD